MTSQTWKRVGLLLAGLGVFAVLGVAVFFACALHVPSGCFGVGGATGGQIQVEAMVVEGTPEDAEVVEFETTDAAANDHLRSLVEGVVGEAEGETPREEDAVLARNTVVVERTDADSVKSAIQKLPRSHPGASDYPRGHYVRYENRTVVLQYLIYD